GQARHFPNNGLGELMRFPRDWQSLVADGCRHGYRMLCPRRSAIRDISRTPARPPKGRDKRAHRAGRARHKFELPVWESTPGTELAPEKSFLPATRPRGPSRRDKLEARIPGRR